MKILCALRTVILAMSFFPSGNCLDCIDKCIDDTYHANCICTQDCFIYSDCCQNVPHNDNNNRVIYNHYSKHY